MAPRIKDLQATIAGLEKALAAQTLNAETQAQEFQATIAAAQAEAEAANAAAAAATVAAAAAAAVQQEGGVGGGNNGAPAMIEEPSGKYNVQRAMGLGSNRVAYKTIQRGIRELVGLAGIDWKIDYRKQDPVKLGNLFQAAIEDHPMLARFANNWVTSKLVKQYLQNRRKYAYRLNILPRPSRRTGRRVRSSAGAGASGSGRSHDENIDPRIV